jgi:predicted ATPase
MLGQTLSFLGAFSTAQGHLEQGMTLYDPEQQRSLASLYGQDQGVICRSWAALALWCLGYPDQALQQSHEALTLAQELAHAFSLAFALVMASALCACLRETHTTQERAEAAIALSTEHRFAQFSEAATIWRGWVRVAQGHGEAGLSQMRQGLAAWRAIGAGLVLPYNLALLAEAYGQGGQAEAGLTVLAEAQALVDNAGGHWWQAELHRLKGELLLRQGVPDERQAETCFSQALAIARRQQAKWAELRTAMCLSRPWQQQGKRTEAHELLTPIYGWFTEGFDTAGLQEAKALLEELR